MGLFTETKKPDQLAGFLKSKIKALLCKEAEALFEG